MHLSLDARHSLLVTLDRAAPCSTSAWGATKVPPILFIHAILGRRLENPDATAKLCDAMREGDAI